MESGRKDVLGCEDRALLAPFLLLGFVDLEGGFRYYVFPWPFLEPTPSLLLSRALPLHTPVGQIFSQRKDTRSHRWEAIPLKTVASRVRSWVLEADAFYRSNKLDTVRLVMYWQVSWSLDYLAQGEEAEAEAKLGSVTRSRSQIGTESS